MKRNVKTAKHQTIKMVAFNNLTRKWEEIMPEDEDSCEKIIPMFRSDAYDSWHTVPDCTLTDELWNQWLGQVR
jgi:hypothetical protein